MKKLLTLTILLLLPVLVSADVFDITSNSDTLIRDTSDWDFLNDIIWDDVTRGIVDTCTWSPPERDTTRWYIKAIREMCDTLYYETYEPAGIPDHDYYSRIYVREIKCKADTAWGEKIQVWLTPEQLERFLGIVTPRKNGQSIEVGVEW